jgi:hypothetical protein
MFPTPVGMNRSLKNQGHSPDFFGLSNFGSGCKQHFPLPGEIDQFVAQPAFGILPNDTRPA